MNRAESYARLKARRPGIEAAEKEIAPYEAIADLILDARVRAGLSQAELARRAGTTQARISEIESGEANTKPETIMRIGEALGAHIDYATLLQALTNLYVTTGTFVPMRTLISTFETEVEDAAVTTRIFYVPADRGLPLFDADNIVVGGAITTESTFIAPGFITVRDNTLSGGVTLVASNAFSYAPHHSLHGIFAGVSETEDEPNGDEPGTPAETPDETPAAANSNLALAA